MTEVFRRVYRIFAHAWFSHRDVFWRVESKTGLYLLFKTVCDEYRLIPEDNYTIPPEAEGIENTPTAPRSAPTILQRDGPDGEPAGNATLATGNTTKRHRHTMSDRAASISTVIHEEVEEEDDGEQSTGSLPYAAPELTRVDTVQHADGPANQQESAVSVEDPPPYPEGTTEQEPEKAQSSTSEPSAEQVTEEASSSTKEADKEQGELPTTEPPSYAEITSASESADDTAANSAPDSEETKAAEQDSGETQEETPAEDSESKSKEVETASGEVKSDKEEEKGTAKPMDPTESDAADETEATKTVAD